MKLLLAPPLALAFLAVLPIPAAWAVTDQVSVTFSVGAQETTLVDVDGDGRQPFEFTLGQLYVRGRAEEDVWPTNGAKTLFLARLAHGIANAEFRNLSYGPLDVTVAVRGQTRESSPIVRLRLNYRGRAHNWLSMQDPVNIPSHQALGWANDIVGPADVQVDGPVIDLPSGEASWDETATTGNLTASRLAFRWTFALGPRDRILLERLELAEACVEPASTGYSGRTPPIARREGNGAAPAGAPIPCALPANLTGDCANYRWYNVCSGYVWIYQQWACGEGAGVLFGGPAQPCVTPGNRVEKTITYFRNVIPSYQFTVDVFLDRDDDGDGCPDGVIASDLGIDPGLRWNCSTFNVCIPSQHLIVRTVHTGGPAPTFATDGPFAINCDPDGVARSYFYDNDGTCVPWTGPTGRHDNFLYWLIVDVGGCPTSTETTTWGHIKGLFH